MITLKVDRSVKYQRVKTVSARVEEFGALAYDHVSRRLVTLSPRPVGQMLVLLHQPLSVTEITTHLCELNYVIDEETVSEMLKSLITANICFEIADDQ